MTQVNPGSARSDARGEARNRPARRVANITAGGPSCSEMMTTGHPLRVDFLKGWFLVCSVLLIGATATALVSCVTVSTRF
jgi:hypothetical protein